MSTIKLPELPSPLKEIAWLGGRPQDVYGRAEMIAYAEEAVRQALAAQQPVAWMTEDGRVSTDATKRTAMPSASQIVFNIPLALIPEARDG